MKDLPWMAAVRLRSAVLRRGDQSGTHKYTFVLHTFLVFNIQSTDMRENQLDATEYFIELIIRSTCFGHLYAHHQELETIQKFTACGT